MRVRSALLALIVLVSATNARAADPADPTHVAEARSAFEKGAALAAEARWSDALAQFERSASLRPHATTTYNIGYCERALGRATRARKHFAAALAQDAAKGGTELSPQLRSATEAYLDEMRARIATATITIAPADAKVSVDGRPLEIVAGGRLVAGTRDPAPGEAVPTPTFVLEIDTGDHEIVVTTRDGRSKVVHESFATGKTKEVRVEVPPAPVAPKPVAVDEGSSRKTWGFVLGGVGLAALGAGTYFALRASSTWSDAKAACPTRTACPTDEGADLSSDARTQANVATIGFAVGAAAIAAGTLLIVTSSSRKDGPVVSAGVAPGLASVRLEARF